ncbi:galactokinase [Salegentibacter sp. T436]|uniref:galactokinase n=1 Tax=Salegentibacter sp. T436 TaxID=1729720 RepID=UPI00094A6880|nr:galactokinase [Salegentibacter sp. T436]APS40589.1 galactokinase [Salegentibacter sp. T436]
MKNSEKPALYPEEFSAFTCEVKVASPGRINLIGEHTDYNHGYVMPTAIDKKIFFEFKKNASDSICRIFSITFNSYFEFNLNDITRSNQSWQNYLLGVTEEIQKIGGKLRGFDCIINTELPIGAGISSSAALECGFASGLNQIFNLKLTKLQIVELSQRAENNFVGSNCGIMDQFASVMSKKDHIILLDCKTLETEYIPADFKNCKLLLLNTNVSHSIADSEYNTRRAECEEAVRIISKIYAEITSLRQVNFDMLSEFKHELTGKAYQRCTYVLKENERVLKASEAMKRGHLKEFGELMYQSHEGLQHNYEVSCSELDFMVAYAKNKNFIYGSRMMGGGFGGCTINLIEADKIKEYSEEISKAYFKEFNRTMDIITVSAGEGTLIEKVKA